MFSHPGCMPPLSSHTPSTALVPGHCLGQSPYLSCPAVSHSCSAKFLLSTVRRLTRKSTPRTHRRKEAFYSLPRAASLRCPRCVSTPNPSLRRMGPHAGLLSVLQATFPRWAKDPRDHAVCSGTLAQSTSVFEPLLWLKALCGVSPGNQGG